MSYIRVENASKAELMSKFQGITNSGRLVDRILEFLSAHENIMQNDEYVEVSKKFPSASPGYMNMLILDTKYSINLKRTTIVLLMFLLDIKFASGIASLSLGLTGYSTQVIQKIEEQEKCLVMDILLGNKKTDQDFQYQNHKCVQNDIYCPYRDGDYCRRDNKKVKKLLDNLLSKEVVQVKDGYFKLTF